MIGKRFIDRAADVIRVQAVALAGMPLRGLMAHKHILVAGKVRRPVDRDAVVIPKDNQPTEP